MDEQRELIIGN